MSELAEAFAALGFTPNEGAYETYSRDGIMFSVDRGRIYHREVVDTSADAPARGIDLQTVLSNLSPTYRMLCELRSLLGQMRDITAHTTGAADFAKQANRAISRLHSEIGMLKSELADAYEVISRLKLAAVTISESE